MKTITNFADLHRAFAAMDTRKRVVTVCPSDDHSREVVKRCLSQRLCSFTLIYTPDDLSWVSAILAEYPETARAIEATDVDDAARKAVAEVRAGSIDVIMKGLINTDNLLRAVLDKQDGILEHGKVMTHITTAEIPGYDHLLVFSDAAVIPYPDLTKFDAMLRYGIAICHKLNVPRPRIALIHFTEKINPKFPYTLAYAEIKRRASEGDYGDVEIDGPMDVKSACDVHSAEIKGIASGVTGHADMLIFPDLVSANTFYKTLTLFARATTAAVVYGAEVPIVTPSRADSVESKFNSLALACLTS